MPSQNIRTLLVETDTAESRYVQRALNPSRASGMQWQLKRAPTFDAAVNQLRHDKFDVILIGLRSTQEHLQQRIRRLHKIAPAVPIVALADFQDKYVLSTACALIATHAVHTRQPSLPAVISALVLPGRPRPSESGIHNLTPRERQIFQLIAEGRSTKEVAEHLDISVKTAETHRSNLMRKLGLRSVTQLVRLAIRHEIVEA